MDTTVVIVVAAVIALVVIAALGWMVYQQKQREQLREGFGPEYDRTIEERGSRGKAEAELRERQERVDKLDIRPLDPNERERFAKSWAATQAHFVDDPTAAVTEADRLCGDLMQVRGYPVGDFEQRAADVSVDHPWVVENYRAAHNIADENASGVATTEDLRQAMVHYRSLFEDLLETGPTTSSERNTAEVRR
ncbi:MAG: hypothetical protein GEU28_05660 [Dehalococcoidia bacterium]|nr:hypothetical protein [Dehalococcoidia bacterium]